MKGILIIADPQIPELHADGTNAFTGTLAFFMNYPRFDLRTCVNSSIPSWVKYYSSKRSSWLSI
jgi:hypothetical protein